MQSFKEYLKEIKVYMSSADGDLTHAKFQSAVHNGSLDEDLDCSSTSLVSLLGAPKEIHGTFNCSRNNLISLEHCPQRIEGYFYCSQNPIKTLEYGPTHVAGSYVVDDCGLETLKGSPERLEQGSFTIQRNKNLKSMKNGPAYVGENYDASFCSIESIDCDPTEINGILFLSRNKITSLVGINNHIKSVSKFIDLSGNDITEGGLGILKIEKIKGISCSLQESTENLIKLTKIINKYTKAKTGSVCTNSEILKCKAELEREGLGAYAVI